MGWIKRIGGHYRNDMRLSSKLLFSHLALILASTIAIASFFGSSVYNMLISTTINEKQQTAFETAKSVEDQLDKLIGHTEEIVSAFYRFTSNRYILKENADPEYGADYLLDSLEFAAEPELGAVYQLYLTPLYQDLIDLPALSGRVQSAENVYGTYWYGILSASPYAQDLFCPSLYLSPQEIERYGELAYVRVLPSRISEAAVGYVVAYFSQASIIEALADNLNVSRGASYIINSRDALVCDSDSELVGAYYINNAEVDHIVQSGGRTTYLNSDIIVGSYPVSRTDWKIVSVLPQTEALGDANRAVLQFFALYGVVAVLSALLSIALARSVSARISSVARQMSRAQTTTRPEEITSLPPAKDEVGQLIQSYNSMVQSLNNLLDREAEAAKTLRLSEFKALQAQINPHFLYNSLDMINWMALAGERERVSEAVQSLGRFYKLTLSRKDTFGTVQKETEHASLYVKLQNMRFENRIHFLVDIDENIQECVMPKLILQPLVENAILHGIMEREDKTGEILLAGWLEGDDLVLLVSDNGVGMTEEQLAHIMDMPEESDRPSKTGSNIGVYNTHERLNLYYGPQYGLRYKSAPGEGTEVTIRLPASTKTNE